MTTDQLIESLIDSDVVNSLSDMLWCVPGGIGLSLSMVIIGALCVVVRDVVKIGKDY